MKKVLLAICLGLANIAFAQPEGRVFTITNETYANLSSATDVTTAGWDDFDAVVPMGFSFHLMGSTVDSIIFDSGVNYGADAIFSYSSLTPSLGMMTDFVDRSTDGIHPESKIKYKTQTVNGKKITKIEWRDAGFYGDSTLNDFVNFQYWFFEGNNNFEVHFGNSSIQTSYENLFDFFKPNFMFLNNFDLTNQVFDTCYLVTNTSPATMDAIDIDSFYSLNTIGYNAWPSNGTVFKFTKPTQSINGVQLNAYATVYPTAFQEVLHIAISAANFKGTAQLIDMNGRVVAKQNIVSGQNDLSVAALASGQYILNIKDENESVFYKVIKQ